ncbi:hypothetical protein SCHPADRAFT_849438 [Schizopora paradoxa]|uniref:F-box domain-containing protein n=1 Tax=Schizopora paradoxa TaxID=27342 RepID=A0A0H2S1B6_9AGAM|nr:hypothetical protein SCHPADRAFT_849438 [Schizopora paradoxa]
MSLLSSVPVEVLEQIFRYILFSRHRQPIALLQTNRLINEICSPMLHADLMFSSTIQLNLFAAQCRLSAPPRTFSLSLPGAVVDPEVFDHLHRALGHCLQCFPDPAKLQLHSMRLCLNSHPMNAEALLRAFSFIDPFEFEWTSPDPDHHFSICIVPQVAESLFECFTSWTRLHHLKLCRLSFPSGLGSGDTTGPTLSSALCTTLQPGEDLPIINDVNIDRTSGRVQPLPYLHTIELSQVIFLDPAEVARIACAPSLARTLRRLSVVDAYQDSIWGPRVRLSDVESALRRHSELIHDIDACKIGENRVDELHIDGGERLRYLHSNLIRLREIVRCEAKIDRIMGGDRADMK